jgi:anaerobic magnesium-protoporphyrin IX monomethyl ester cyclase
MMLTVIHLDFEKIDCRVGRLYESVKFVIAGRCQYLYNLPFKARMADVILFRPKFLDYSVEALPIPWGLLYVGSSLSESGYSVRIIDELTHSNWKNTILDELKNRPKLVGISAMTGKQIKYGLQFSAFIKERSSVPIIWGGVHPSIFPEQTLQNKHVDFIAQGESEETILEFMQHLDGKKDIKGLKGIGFKEKDTIHINKKRPFSNLDNLPRLDYSQIDVERYIGKRFDSQRSFELCTSRGCPHQCRFCYNLNYYQNRWRPLSVDKIFNHLYEIIDTYQIDGLTWREDNFFVDRKRAQKIAERIIEEKIKINWHADCRIDYINGYDDSFIALLKKSGCHTLTLGAESGSNRILEHINKGITREQILRAKEKLSRHGIYQNYHFMMGLPGETDEDIKKTIDLIYTLMHKNKYFGDICGPSLYTPYPGTALYGESLKKGFEPPEILEGWIDMDWHSLRLPWITGKQRKTVEDIAWNIMGMGQKPVHTYFKWKFYLLAKYNILIPCFERKIFNILKNINKVG